MVQNQGGWLKITLAAALIGGLFAVTPVAAQASGRVPPFAAAGSVDQVYATGLIPNASVALLKSGHAIASKQADPLGGVVFYGVAPGTGYRVREVSNGAQSGLLTVHTTQSAPWDPTVYNQSIPSSGYGYLTTRDGIKLAIDVHPPTSPAGLAGVTLPSALLAELRADLPVASATFPTLIEYSGYGYANPAGPESGIAILANLMGFTVVDVNMRGTGCSGGAFNYFEPLQNLDGYDVIETIARQPWVRGHKVGMMGISYGAISQLFTAQTQPPSLEAIAPLSTIDATATTLYPGGILNTGFAVAWAGQRQFDAEPAGPSSGEAWAYQRIQQGDQTCNFNQDLHGEAGNLLATIQANSHYQPAVADPLDPITFVGKIRVPVFMACQWEDEQTGGHCADLAAHFTGTKQKWFTFTNGVHTDSLDPYTYDRWFDFLQLFVAHAAPVQTIAVTDGAAPLIYQQAMGFPSTDTVTLPPDPIQTIPTYAAALAAFEKLPEVRVLFDNGAGKGPAGSTNAAGNPYPAYQETFSQFPIPGTVAQRWYLGPGGTLGNQAPGTPGVDTYTSNASALPLTDYTGNTGGGGLWGNASQWQWNWQPNPAGSAVSFLSAPLSANTTVIGGGAVDLWVRSSTPDVDLQATVSEVDANGKETFVQDGWIRASERKLSTGTNNVLHQLSTPLEPIPSMLASDVQPMPANQFVPVVIPLYFEGHAYRAGTRIRVTIAAPNGAQPVWSFAQTEPPTTGQVSVAFSTSMPSSLVLPVIPGVSVPTGLPACPSLRNEPCR